MARHSDARAVHYRSGRMSSPLVRAAFALLVLATVAAFVVTQQLKDEFPLVLRFAAKPSAISPNGDRVRDRTKVGFDLSEPAKVSFSIVNSDGNEVRRLVDERRVAGDAKHRFSWNGRDDEGRIVPDGSYRMRVIRRDEGRVINSGRKIRVDTRPPRVRLTSARPGVISPGEGRPTRVRISYRGPRNEAPELRLFRTDEGSPRVVFRFRGDREHGATWDGQVRGRPAADGDYAFTVTVRDKAGNRTVAPATIPSPRSAAAGTGVAVRRLTLRGPLGIVQAGSVARLRVGPGDRSFDFTLSRLGARRPTGRGQRLGNRLSVRIPPKAHTGVYVIRVRAGRDRPVWPIAVSGLPQTRGAARRARPLVVLPAISWQGANRYDDDLDGFADTLDSARSVRLGRPFARGGLPPGFASQASPLLRFLDRERLAYDLTTDVALARRQGPALGNAPGVALAGSERWLTPELGRRLRRYVADGGRVVSFGADALRREVRLGADSLRDSSPPRPENVLGERTGELRTTPAPLVVADDGLGVFEGLDRFVGNFSVFELSKGLPRGGRALTSAGRDPGEPAFVAYELGKGLVVRTGTPQWASQLSEGGLDVEVPRATRRIWGLLGR
jgi:N,N-dimethylformamidase beta subunit-like protein/flagellar hook capping protein FlgD